MGSLTQQVFFAFLKGFVNLQIKNCLSSDDSRLLIDFICLTASGEGNSAVKGKHFYAMNHMVVKSLTAKINKSLRLGFRGQRGHLLHYASTVIFYSRSKFALKKCGSEFSNFAYAIIYKLFIGGI